MTSRERENLLNGTWREKENPMSDAPERDWSKWLPPAPLPDTGPKVVANGQVWAGYGPGGVPGVFEVWFHGGGSCGPWANMRDLTGGGTARFNPQEGMRHAVLVQDVGQPEPTPPEVLYGPRYDYEQRPVRANHVGISKDGKLGVCFTRPEEAQEARIAASAGALLPGDVITTFGHRFKLLDLEISAEADREGRQQWHVEPLEPQFSGNVDHIRFAPADVTKVVPGWRAGQRRRIRVHAIYGGGTVDGIISKRHDGVSVDGMPHVAVNLDATASRADQWLLRAEGAMYWASETEWSELLTEAPSVRVDGDVYVHAPSAEPGQWHGWRPGQKRHVRTENGDAVGYLTPVTWEALLGYVEPAPGDRAPLREVSSNGREWVNYDRIDEVYPFETYARRRVDGVDAGYVEPAAVACALKRVEGKPEPCPNEAKLRVRDGGVVPLCDEHLLWSERDIAAVMRNHQSTHAARARMAEMDRNATADPPVEPSCQPTLFGGIWRPW